LTKLGPYCYTVAYNASSIVWAKLFICGDIHNGH
jgi:hypothetical protein